MVKLKVKEAIEKRGYSQRYVARKAGLRENAISDMVRNSRTCVNFNALSAVACALDITDIRELIDFS